MGGPAHLTVRYQLQRIHGEHVLTDTKTDSAGRVVHLPPTIQAALREHRVRQAEERLAAGRKWRRTDQTEEGMTDPGKQLVFTTAEGQPVSEQTAHWILARACERAGTRHVSLHDFRRYSLTIVESKLGRDAAQRLGGHANPKETERYISTTALMLAQVAEALEEEIG